MVGCVIYLTSCRICVYKDQIPWRQVLVLLCYGHIDDPVTGHGRTAVHYPQKAEPGRYQNCAGAALVFRYRVLHLHAVQFFRGVPKELDEAAEIDGCGKIAILFKILVPVVKPAIMTASIFAFYWVMAGFLPAVDLYEYTEQVHTVTGTEPVP